MSRLQQGALLFFLAAGYGLAGTISFFGTFSQDDDVALFNITANSSELITVETSSYATGGFAPTAFLFDGLGDVFPLTNGTCGQVGKDSGTGNCDDLYFKDTLGPGTFTLALAVYDNRPLDTSVTDGFIQDGNPGFTCQEAGVGGSFCDLTTALGTSRTGAYAISITGADLVSQEGVPEPGSMGMLLAGGALILLLRSSLVRRLAGDIVPESLFVVPIGVARNGPGGVGFIGGHLVRTLDALSFFAIRPKFLRPQPRTVAQPVRRLAAAPSPCSPAPSPQSARRC
jgi:hypothetical protein